MHAVALPHLALPRITITRRVLYLLLFAAILCCLLMSSADAGTTGEEFRELYDKFMGWSKGYLGKTIAAFAFLLGIGVSAGRQNMMPAIYGLILALIIGFGPELQESVLSAQV
ncbi:hypothetical protein IP91_00352 [Pseudoduganella lurida]|uniref:Pili assembly chaperone n=1 Tax=Pseudoduganella lurida TaxID=1036180 RepID=A0A562RJP7_9BURK|nr:TraA family conjugative transfer protein [Pseudoduganella lurida]TWI69285.1 hypothetical protein IP91_00352 [Pseudoduganella lurida]